MQVDPLYQVKVNCAYCESVFETSRVRPSFKKAAKTDTDFCMYYNGINADYYVVRVCPMCGYASTENFSTGLSAKHRKIFEERVAKHWTVHDYGGERTWKDALECFKLALLSAQIKEEKPRVISGLLHHIAWLYRSKNNVEQEQKFLQFALDAYVHVYETDSSAINNARLMYIIGELNRRLRNYNDAVKWFTRVINDKSIMDAGMIRACREQWALLREQMQEEQLELDPE